MAAAIYVKNTPNTTQNPDGVQTGDFFQFKPGSEQSNRFILQDRLTFWNQTSNDVTFRSDNATNHALGVSTTKDIRGLSVRKTGIGSGTALFVDNYGTGTGLHITQRGAANAISIVANNEANAGQPAILVNGYTHGARYTTFADGGIAMLINKTTSGGGDVLRLVNNGTGDTVNYQDGSGTVARVNPNGEYENLIAGSGPILRAPNGTRYRATATNGGEIVLSRA